MNRTVVSAVTHRENTGTPRYLSSVRSELGDDDAFLPQSHPVRRPAVGHGVGHPDSRGRPGAPAADAQRLDTALGTDLDETQLAELRRIIDDSGAHAQVESVITELAARASTILRQADLDEPPRGALLELATAATECLN